jgi:hypothetical protein
MPVYAKHHLKHTNADGVFRDKNNQIERDSNGAPKFKPGAEMYFKPGDRIDDKIPREAVKEFLGSGAAVESE